MIPSCSIRWVSPKLIDNFSIQFVVNAPKARRGASKLLGRRLYFAFDPGEYASALPDIAAKQAYLRQLKETSEGAYIRYVWPEGFAEYVIFVKPVSLPDGNVIYGIQTQDQPSVNLLFELPTIGSKRPVISTKHPTYTLTLENLRSLSSGTPTRLVEPLERAYDPRFPQAGGSGLECAHQF